MRIVFAGTPEPAVPALAALIASPLHDVVGVLTRPDAVSGRGRTVRRSPVGHAADEAQLPVATPTSLRTDDARAIIEEFSPDCVAVVAYGALVPDNLLDVPTHGWINLHFSLLPAWRGAAPVQAAIAAGDEITGASTFRIDSGLDTGDVFGTVTDEIRSDDTAGVLLERLSHSGAGLLVATMDGIESGELRAQPQAHDGISHAAKISVDDARIAWNRPAHIVDRQIRSVTPAPGAWTELDGVRLKVGRVTQSTSDPVAPGVVVAGKREVIVGTSSKPVVLSTVQPPGKKPMSAADWARGAHLLDTATLQ